VATALTIRAQRIRPRRRTTNRAAATRSAMRRTALNATKRGTFVAQCVLVIASVAISGDHRI
jgi:hypothetical protein